MCRDAALYCVDLIMCIYYSTYIIYSAAAVCMVIYNIMCVACEYSESRLITAIQAIINNVINTFRLVKKCQDIPIIYNTYSAVIYPCVVIYVESVLKLTYMSHVLMIVISNSLQ